MITHMEKVRLQELLEDGTEEAWEGAFPLQEYKNYVEQMDEQLKGRIFELLRNIALERWQ